MPNQTDDTYHVSCRDERGDAIEVIYDGSDYGEACQRGAAHVDGCAHANGVEVVSVRTDYYGMAHISARWSRRRF